MDAKLLFRWRWAIASSQGPCSPTTRHVLQTLSLHMQEDGSSAFPSETTLATETGLTDRAVRAHLRCAQQEGWLERKLVARRGKNWKRYIYRPCFPPTYRPERRSGPSTGLQEHQTNVPESRGTFLRNCVPTNSTDKSTKKTGGEGFRNFRKKAQELGIASEAIEDQQSPRPDELVNQQATTAALPKAASSN